ncbi:hypothetical protein [Radiobacillus sp. PE A8.2]
MFGAMVQVNVLDQRGSSMIGVMVQVDVLDQQVIAYVWRDGAGRCT